MEQTLRTAPSVVFAAVSWESIWIVSVPVQKSSHPVLFALLLIIARVLSLAPQRMTLNVWLANLATFSPKELPILVFLRFVQLVSTTTRACVRLALAPMANISMCNVLEPRLPIPPIVKLVPPTAVLEITSPGPALSQETPFVPRALAKRVPTPTIAMELPLSLIALIVQILLIADMPYRVKTARPLSVPVVALDIGCPSLEMFVLTVLPSMIAR